jgi:hypothetical protein
MQLVTARHIFCSFAILCARATLAQEVPSSSDLERLRALVEKQGQLIDQQNKRLDALERQNRDLQVLLNDVKGRADASSAA